MVVHISWFCFAECVGCICNCSSAGTAVLEVRCLVTGALLGFLSVLCCRGSACAFYIHRSLLTRPLKKLTTCLATRVEVEVVHCPCRTRVVSASVAGQGAGAVRELLHALVHSTARIIQPLSLACAEPRASKPGQGIAPMPDRAARVPRHGCNHDLHGTCTDRAGARRWPGGGRNKTRQGEAASSALSARFRHILCGKDTSRWTCVEQSASRPECLALLWFSGGHVQVRLVCQSFWLATEPV